MLWKILKALKRKNTLTRIKKEGKINKKKLRKQENL